MLFILFKSILAGLVLGTVHGFLFFKKLRKLYMSKLNSHGPEKENNSPKLTKKKDLFGFSLFSILSYISLICVFIFLFTKCSINILAVLVTFIISFWGTILLFTKDLKTR